MAIRRIGIMGVGSIGSVVGGMLTLAGHDVTLIDQWPEHVEKMKADGLQLSGTCGDHVVPVKALHLYEAQGIQEPFDAVFLAVKGYDTEWATHFILRFLAEPDGVIVDFQNGINDRRVAAIAGEHRTLGSVITIGAGLYEPGHVIRTDRDFGFHIGELDGEETLRVHDIVEIMNAVAPSHVTNNLFGDRWSKLAVNCMVNPIAGLSGYGSNEVRTVPYPRGIAIQVAAEVIKVGRAAGYEVEPLMGIEAQKYVDAVEGRNVEALYAEMLAKATATSVARPSLLQDVMRGRRTEIEDLNGLVVREGKRLGIPTPFNEAIVREVSQYAPGTLTPDPKHLEPLAAMLPK